MTADLELEVNSLSRETTYQDKALADSAWVSA